MVSNGVLAIYKYYTHVLTLLINKNMSENNQFYYYTPTHRVGAILQSPCPFVHPSDHTFVTDISASTGRNDFIFDIWLWHDDLYRVSPFQVYRTSTSCLPCDIQMNEWGYS